MSKKDLIIEQIREFKLPFVPLVPISVVEEIIDENIKEKKRKSGQYMALIVEGCDEPLAIGNQTKILSLKQFLYHAGLYRSLIEEPISYRRFKKMKADGYYVV